MAEKRILLANADAEAVAEFRQVFEQPWEVITASTGPAALAELGRGEFDVLVADLDLPELDGAALLNQTRREHPKTLCFILATEADRDRVMQNVLGAHQFLSKPCNAATLKSHIERALALDLWIASNSMRELVSRVRTFPTVPTLYLEVLSALRSPDATTEQVGRIIARDMAMTTKLLQVINSACFGIPRRINDPVEAVGLMGFDAVKSMVMAIKLLSQYDKIKPVYFSIDRLWRHSTDVARSAKQLVLMHTDDAVLAETAFTAGLIHDMGKVVLAANFDEQYRGAQSLARKQNLPLWEVEREIFGASHGEIGAYLLGLWGMPLDLMECSALHHQPGRSISKDFTALTAVHVANALEHEATPEREETPVASGVDEEYLANIGVLDRLEGWRVAVLKRDFAKPEPKRKISQPEPVRAKQAEKHAEKRPARTAPLPAAKSPARTQNSPPVQPAWLQQNKGIVYLAAGAAGLVLLAVVLLLSRQPGATDNTPSEGSASTSNGVAQVSPGSTGRPGTATSTVSSILSPTLTVRARTADTTVPTSAPAKPVEKPLTVADLKLQGIFYSPKDASAIISGKMVHQGELAYGARVVDITSTTVTLAYQGQLKTLILK
jgi:HD-like signal output (HDOD) protein/CheY-like chemotaxis protein